jgi:hypothetical protein
MQTDGNLVLYNNNQGNPIWASNTTGNVGAYLDVQSDGNLVVYSGSHVPLWNPTPSVVGTPVPTLVLQDDGNLVLYGTNGFGEVSAAWATNTVQNPFNPGFVPVLTGCDGSSPSQLNANQALASGACLFSPDHDYQLIMQADGNLVLYYTPTDDPLWASFPSGPPPSAAGQLAVLYGNGNFCAGGWCQIVNVSLANIVLQDDGNLVEYVTNVRPYAVWATGTNGLRGNRLGPNNVLNPNENLESANGQYDLTMGSQGTLVLYQVTQVANQNKAYQCPLWSLPSDSKVTNSNYDGIGGSNNQEPGLPAGIPRSQAGSYGQIFNPTPASYLIMQSSGNLVLSPPAGSSGATWNAGTTGNAGATLALQNDGNLVVYSAGGTPLWATGTNNYRGGIMCTDTQMTANQFIKLPTDTSELSAAIVPDGIGNVWLAMQSDCNVVLYQQVTGSNQVLWASNTDEGDNPPAGTNPSSQYFGCYVIMQEDGNLVMYAPNHSGAIWATGSNQSISPILSPAAIGPYMSAVYPSGAGYGVVADSSGNLIGYMCSNEINVRICPNSLRGGSSADSEITDIVEGVAKLMKFTLTFA